MSHRLLGFIIFLLIVIVAFLIWGPILTGDVPLGATSPLVMNPQWRYNIYEEFFAARILYILTNSKSPGAYVSGLLVSGEQLLYYPYI